jgi:hypothetical protein
VHGDAPAVSGRGRRGRGLGRAGARGSLYRGAGRPLPWARTPRTAVRRRPPGFFGRRARVGQELGRSGLGRAHGLGPIR